MIIIDLSRQELILSGVTVLTLLKQKEKCGIWAVVKSGSSFHYSVRTISYISTSLISALLKKKKKRERYFSARKRSC